MICLTCHVSCACSGQLAAWVVLLSADLSDAELISSQHAKVNSMHKLYTESREALPSTLRYVEFRQPSAWKVGFISSSACGGGELLPELSKFSLIKMV